MYITMKKTKTNEHTKQQTDKQIADRHTQADKQTGWQTIKHVCHGLLKQMHDWLI